MNVTRLTAFIFFLFLVHTTSSQYNAIDEATTFVSIKNKAAQTDIYYKAEPSNLRKAFQQLETLMDRRLAGSFVLGHTKSGQPVAAYYFPGTGNKRAVVIGGMHGSELSSIEVARRLIVQLEQDIVTDYHVLIIPSLFPDNARKALQHPSEIGNEKNIGRYTSDHHPDPNRQMPAPGKAFYDGIPYDMHGRNIEQENQWLLQTIQAFNPERILNIHAVRNVEKAGIFADPRTDAESIALGFAPDSTLAVRMAAFIASQGGKPGGNQLGVTPTAIYHHDFQPVGKGEHQLRNLAGSRLPAMRGSGASLGTWASTAVKDIGYSRPAITIVTMEFPGSKRPEDYPLKEQQSWCKEEIERYASSISQIFLNQNFQN
jgi:hypothetical protein